MQNLVEIPTPLELVSLSVNDLSERKQQIMNQMYEYVRQGQSTLELSKVYKLYQEEWLMRLQIGIYKHSHRDNP